MRRAKAPVAPCRQNQIFLYSVWEADEDMGTIKGVAVVIDYVLPIAVFADMDIAKHIVGYWAAHHEESFFKGSDVSLVDFASGEQVTFVDQVFSDGEPCDPDLLAILRQLAAETFGGADQPRM